MTVGVGIWSVRGLNHVMINNDSGSWYLVSGRAELSFTQTHTVNRQTHASAYSKGWQTVFPKYVDVYSKYDFTLQTITSCQDLICATVLYVTMQLKGHSSIYISSF